MKNNIAKYRVPLGLSQHRLAKKVGITRFSIMKYENDEREPTLKIAYEISNALNQPLDKVFILE